VVRFTSSRSICFRCNPVIALSPAAYKHSFFFKSYLLCDRSQIANVIAPIIIKRVTASPKALSRLHSGILCIDLISLD
jgi:hypothetical protein